MNETFSATLDFIQTYQTQLCVGMAMLVFILFAFMVAFTIDRLASRLIFFSQLRINDTIAICDLKRKLVMTNNRINALTQKRKNGRYVA